MCSNEFILHHDTVFLVLEEDHPDGPVINTVPEVVCEIKLILRTVTIELYHCKGNICDHLSC